MEASEQSKWGLFTDDNFETHGKSLIQMNDLINQLRCSRRRRLGELAQRKSHLSKLSQPAQRQVLQPLAQCPYQQHVMENTRLKMKCDNIEMNIRRERTRIAELQDRLRLYDANMEEAELINQRLLRDHSRLQLSQSNTLRQIEDQKHMREIKVSKLRAVKSDREEYRIKLSKKTEVEQQQNLKTNYNSTNASHVLQTQIEDQNGSQMTKAQVKCILRCMYVLNALTERQAVDTPEDIIGRERARILSKNEMIEYFKQSYFEINGSFEHKILKHHRQLRIRQKQLEVEFEMKQEVVGELRNMLLQLEQELKNHNGIKTFLEELKLGEIMIKELEQEHCIRQNQIIRQIQFFQEFISRLIRVFEAIRSVAGSYYPRQPADDGMDELIQNWYNDKHLSVGFEDDAIWDESMLQHLKGGGYYKPDRITRLFFERLEDWHSVSNPLQITDHVYKQVQFLATALAKTFKSMSELLKALTAPYKKPGTKRLIDKFKDSYCIESPEFYCRNNMKLLEKLEAIKMRNMGTRKLIPANMEINLQGPIKDRPYALRRRYPQQQVPEAVINFSSLSQRFTKTPDTQSTPFTNLHSDRRREHQSQNMSVRNIVSMIKKIGILSSGTARSRTSRRKVGQTD